MPAAGITSAEAFIRQRFELAPLSFRPDISLYRPTPRSGLTGFLAAQGRDGDAPYWAYPWAGGAALALHLAQNPVLVSGRTVLDWGAGSGLVAIAAARAGAMVTAFEPDPLGRIATALNAGANAVDIRIVETPVPAEIVLAGDVFYDAEIAAAVRPALAALAENGATVVIGDPYRRDLPLDHLSPIADYLVPDMGGAGPVRAGVFTLRPGHIGNARTNLP